MAKSNQRRTSRKKEESSRLTVSVKIAGLLLSVLSIIVTAKLLYDSVKHPKLTVELFQGYTHLQVRVLNKGMALAKDIYVDVGAKGISAPAPMTIRKNLHDLMPNSDSIINVDFFPSSSLSDSGHSAYFGYIAVFCSNCVSPKAWAYYMPEGGSEDMTYLLHSRNLWPIQEFKYLDYIHDLGRHADSLKRTIAQLRETERRENK